MSEGPRAARLSDRQLFDWLRLIRSENVGPRTFRSLVNRFGGAAAALDALPDLAAQRGRVLKIAAVEDIEREMAAAARHGVRFLTLGDPDYPHLLRNIDAPPPVLALRGRPDALRRASVAIVGSRNASAAGLAFTERLARGLAQQDYVVVSGLARGVDARAHQATLDTGTVAVLAGGHDRLYPADHGPLLDRILERGAALSEMPMGWEPRGRDFPRRNRIVAGLTLGTIVVEAARRSGSLITAQFAIDHGREVFAVPGSPMDPRAEGANDLLRQGATLCAGAGDVVAVLDRQRQESGQASGQRDLFAEGAGARPTEQPLWDELDFLGDGAPVAARSALADEAEESAADPVDVAARIVALLGPSPVSIDELARAANAPVSDVRRVLLELEIEGRLARAGVNLVSLA